jgi:uncharacterized membrane protein
VAHSASALIELVNETGARTMNNADSIFHAAIAGLLTIGAGSSSVYAADDHRGDEQCAGIVKAGQNDCATSMNACHGHVEVNSGPMAWIYVPKGTCDKIAGAHVVHVTDPTPKKS